MGTLLTMNLVPPSFASSAPNHTAVGGLNWLSRFRALACASWLLMFAPPLWAATFNTMLSDVDWQVEQSVFECRLSQPVTGFGQATFSRRAGEPETFYLQQKQILLPEGEATIGLGGPSWRQPGHHPQSLARAEVVAEAIPLRLETSVVKTLQAELLKGLRVIITRKAGDAMRNPVRVVVEPLKLRGALPRYQACLKQLLPVSYADVARTTVYFDNAADLLPLDERRKLDWIALYVKEDAQIKRILIDGHTDSIGPRPKNLEISKARSQNIAAYLENAGVERDKITVRWHGERYPVATNATDQGRHKNRRVTIRLER